MDLIIELNKKMKELDKAIKELANNGYTLAEAERGYKVLINKKALECKAQDMPITLINITIYGFEDVADLRLKRDIAQVKYNSNQEYINTLKLQIRILESQVSREYGQTK